LTAVQTPAPRRASPFALARRILAVGIVWLLPATALAADQRASRPAPTPERAAAELGYDLSRPLTLDQCIAIALRAHPDIRVAVAALHGAIADLDRARAALWPSVTGGTDYTVTKNPQRTVQVGGVPVPVGGGQTTTRNWALTGSYTVYQMGRDLTISQAKTMRRAAGAGVEDTCRELAYLVSQAYFGVLAADRLVKAQEESAAAAQGHVDSVQALIDADEAAPVEIHTVRAQLHQAQLDLLSARNQAAIARANLRAALGGPATEVQIADAWREPTSLPVLSECLEAAGTDRPDVQQARASLRAATLGLRLARLQQYPQVGVGTSAEWGRFNGDTGSGWSVFGSIEQPLFDGGAVKAGIDSARADVESAQAQLDRLSQQMRLEVETAWLNLRRSAEGIAAAEAARTEARASLAAAERRYPDAAILLEVIDAQARATRAEVDYISAIYDYNIALADLQRATAGEREQGTGDK